MNKNNVIQATALETVYLDFILSRQAMLCSPATVKWYKSTLTSVIRQLNELGVKDPKEIKAHHIRVILSSMVEAKKSDSYVNIYARVIKTFIRFLKEENYIAEMIVFKMPTIAQKRLPCLQADDVQRVLKACTCPRDKALVFLMVDTGLRRTEVCALDWGQIDIASGLVHVVRGKGGKARSVVVGATTRRALLAYKRTILASDERQPLFQTSYGDRLKVMGLRSVFKRLSEVSGVHLTPHVLRRTFATLSLRAGMNLLYLQGLMGHSTIEMTRRYVQMIDDDLLEAHREHGPIDTLVKR